jgi:putative transposase
LPEISYVGDRWYFLTICTFERRRHFLREDVVLAVWSQFLRTSREQQFETVAHCFMPDHVHLLVEGRSPQADLRAFVAVAKQRAAYVARHMVAGRLWQTGYFDRILRDDDDLFEFARYILQDPVRTGLVTSPLDYPFLGSETLSIEDLVGKSGLRHDAP